ncbi:MAG: hypothetical protein EXR99_14385 [Gemmataceae bacterium]|nr:hypothetical protein [Gemmataceae bacterium]
MMFVCGFLALCLAEPEVDTSAIRKAFDQIKKAGTPVRVLSTTGPGQPAYFKRSFELTSYDIEVSETGNKVIPYLAVVQFRARIKTSKEFSSKEEAEEAPFKMSEDSFIEWRAIFRNLKGSWAMENLLYRSSSFQIWCDLKTTLDARHFVHDWFNALDGY